MRHAMRLTLVLTLALLAGPLLLAGFVAVTPLDAPATLALAQSAGEVAAAEEPVDVRTLWELLSGAYAAPAAAGAFVVALLGFIRARTGHPTGILAVLSAAGLSLLVAIGGIVTGALEGTFTAVAIPFAMNTFAAAIAGREVLVNTARAAGGTDRG